MTNPPQAAFEAEQTEAELMTLVAKSVAWFDSLSPNEQDAHRKTQAESWARAMLPCKHGVGDWETCSQCREEAAQPTPPSSEPDDFASATQIARAVLAAHWRDPALSTLAEAYLRLAQAYNLTICPHIVTHKLADGSTQCEDCKRTWPPGWTDILDFPRRELTDEEAFREWAASSPIPQPASSSADDEALIERLRNRREMVNYGNGDVRDIPDEDCNLAAGRLAALSRQPDRDAVIEAAISVLLESVRTTKPYEYQRGLEGAIEVVRALAKSRPATQPQESKG